MSESHNTKNMDSETKFLESITMVMNESSKTFQKQEVKHQAQIDDLHEHIKTLQLLIKTMDDITK